MIRDWIRRLFIARGHLPREADMDGELHVEGECCGDGDIMGRECRKCGARRHQQPVYGGIADLCERCPEDADHWYPRGTYRTEEMVGDDGVAGSFLL